MSLFRQYAQPITGSWVNTQDYANSEYGPYSFRAVDFDDWYAANKQYITKVSSTLYIIPGTALGSKFTNVLLGTNARTELNAASGYLQSRRNLKDMGKEIVIGSAIVTRLLVFRKVQRPTADADGGSLSSDDNAYVLVENNSSELPSNDNGRFLVRVARA
jgi:hypothetical protein